MGANHIATTSRSHNIVVVGAGVAGLVLSLLLKRAGIEHVLLSRKETQKPLPLGETLPPSAFGLLDRLDLSPLFEQCGTPTYGYQSMWGSERIAEQQFFGQQPRSTGLKLDKAALIKALQQEVKEHVLEFDDLLEAAADAESARLTLNAGNKRIEATSKLVVDATGRARALLKRLGIGQQRFDNTVASYCHVPRIAHPQLMHGVYIESFAEGWGIVSHLDEERTAITVFTNKGNAVLRHLKHFEGWQKALAETVILKDFLAAGPLSKVSGRQANSSKAAQLAGKRWLAIGDAGIAFDPLSSHGITNAIYGAHRGFEAIRAQLGDAQSNALATYAETLNRIFDGYLRQRGGLYASEQRWRTEFWAEQMRLRKSPVAHGADAS